MGVGGPPRPTPCPARGSRDAAGRTPHPAGSDSSGGAGIPADPKTFAALGAYGASVITAVTAQNTLGVTAVHPVPAEIVAAQLDAVLSDVPVAAVEVGMVGDPAVARVIAGRAGRLPHLVVDPVLVATSGSRLGAVPAVGPLSAYRCVLTPNRHEAGALLGLAVDTVDEMVAAAADLAAAGPGSVVVTGSEPAVGVLHHDGRSEVLRGSPVSTADDHGPGGTFSAAIAVRLAAGDPVPEAVRVAKAYVAGALRGGRAWRLGAGPGPLDHRWSA